MISFKIQGVAEIVYALRQAGADLPSDVIDKAVKEAALPVVTALKNNYISDGHNKTGELVASIQTFQRRRKSQQDPYFTYYVGPKYGGKSHLSAAGNAAHLLEWGTVERFVANKSKGGASFGKGRTYGAKSSRGAVTKGLGTIRRTYDQMQISVTEFLAKRVPEAILNHFEAMGFPTFK